jgi:hypothetical protein
MSASGTTEEVSVCLLSGLPTFQMDFVFDSHFLLLPLRGGQIAPL